jgi:N-acetylglutamate synthase-like GNAT family acetyltransferase
MIKIINLRKEEFFIPRYVDLRNSYVDLLLTNPVTINETREWLLNENVEVRCLIDNNDLIGVAILYLNKRGEITLFIKYPGRGIGSKMIDIIEKVAKEKNLSSVWAWVLSNNLAAQKTFTKKGYLLEEEIEKKYKNNVHKGIVFRKKFNVGD